MTTTKTLATIELDENLGRGELYLQDGSIWCRQPDGVDFDTTQGAGRIVDENEAREVIEQCWAAGGADWNLEWVR